MDSRDHKQTHHLLDMRGTFIPITLLKVTQAFRELHSGETMEILLGDPAVKEDLLKVLPVSRYEVIESQQDEASCRIILRKGRKKHPSLTNRTTGSR